MEIKLVNELDEGKVEYTAVLDADETSFLLEFAINNLLAMGVSPFYEKAAQEEQTLTHQGSTTVQ